MKEIGGQIFGEQLAPSEFRATELTIQTWRGTFASFIVDLARAARDATRFFDRTGHRYVRFNYIGEWHSHPAFAIEPSDTDRRSMRGIVDDIGFQGSFAILMITRLEGTDLKCGAWLFAPNGIEENICLEWEQ